MQDLLHTMRVNLLSCCLPARLYLCLQSLHNVYVAHLRARLCLCLQSLNKKRALWGGPGGSQGTVMVEGEEEEEVGGGDGALDVDGVCGAPEAGVGGGSNTGPGSTAAAASGGSPHVGRAQGVHVAGHAGAAVARARAPAGRQERVGPWRHWTC